MDNNSNINKKSLTNLYDEPSIIVNKIEPISDITYSLGSSSNPWKEIYVNSIARPENATPLRVVIPSMRSNTTDPPSTLSGNSNTLYYLKRNGSASSTLYKYVNNTPQIVDPPQGMFLYDISTTASSNHIYMYTPAGWLRQAINQSG